MLAFSREEASTRAGGCPAIEDDYCEKNTRFLG
jgi:hypothetical protein